MALSLHFYRETEEEYGNPLYDSRCLGVIKPGTSRIRIKSNSLRPTHAEQGQGTKDITASLYADESCETRQHSS
jgi:hypothetical protein